MGVWRRARARARFLRPASSPSASTPVSSTRSTSSAHAASLGSSMMDATRQRAG